MGLQTEVKLYTMCMIQDGSRILLMNRPDAKGFPGYIAPGGKVDFPESIVNGAIREVREETGLIVKDIIYKGLEESCEPNTGLRYMVFNYLATSFGGELLENPPEGELVWVDLEEALKLPMQDWFKRRFPLFFEEGTFELSEIWDEKTGIVLEETVKQYPARLPQVAGFAD
ncbi:8-oxo-dGTP diphosphatase [Paenibacillus glucanolyticus]|uniref:8-oxo-dGTP diphosphatase n=1 Tax=Paenibacillus glucanolyticus TaxID=59843 RepID=UPI00096EC64C|nr:8-oxo-dGTP diphosphatase [Paenibacillus glucanolyticus]MPY17073.1 8-oxo-dGTP diphosphatase [Paenibacillus glucanolyticus]OMF80784.1 DNA mismatch repair protein MutT [Paenibacillus glucanolyticus]